MASSGNFVAYAATSTTNPHSATLVLGSGTERVVVIGIAVEAARTISSVTVGGSAATLRSTNMHQHPSDSTQRLALYDFYVSNATPAGNITVSVTTDSSTNAISFYAQEKIGVAAGGPESTPVYASATGASSATATVTATQGATLFGVGMIAAASQTITVGGTTTQLAQLNEAAYTSASGTADNVAAGSRTMTVTPSSGSNSSVLLASYANAAVPALVIDAQPANSWNGAIIRPAITVRATTNGVDTDASTTVEIVASRIAGTGTLSGDVDRNAVSGTGAATFSDLVITGIGAHRLRFAATGFASVDSNIFNVATGTGVPSGGSTYEEADMQQEAFARGALSKTVELIVKNTDGSRATGLAHTAVACWRSIDGGTPQQVTLSAGTVGTYSSGGWAELSAANKPGKYAFGLPTLPTSGDSIVYTFTGTGLQPSELRVTLTADDPRAPTETKEAIATETREAIDAAPVVATGAMTLTDIGRAAVVLALVRASNGLDGYGFERDEDNNVIRVTLPGTGVVTVPAVFTDLAKAVTKVGS